jgi:hypothetical protein
MGSRLRGKLKSKQPASEPRDQPDQAQAEEDFKNRHAHRQGSRDNTSPVEGVLPYEKLSGSSGNVANKQH